MVKGNARGSRKKRKGGRRTKGWRLDPLKAEAKTEEVEINGLALNPPIEDLYVETQEEACLRAGTTSPIFPDKVSLPEVKPLWAIRLWRWLCRLFGRA